MANLCQLQCCLADLFVVTETQPWGHNFHIPNTYIVGLQNKQQPRSFADDSSVKTMSTSQQKHAEEHKKIVDDETLSLLKSAYRRLCAPEFKQRTDDQSGKRKSETSQQQQITASQPAECGDTHEQQSDKSKHVESQAQFAKVSAVLP